MYDLIDRQQAIDKALTFFVEFLGGAFEEEGQRLLIKQMNTLPTIEPMKGRWIPVDSYSAFGGDEATWMAHGNPVAFYYCSECKEQPHVDEEGKDILSDFCPFCGADMREGDSE